MTLLQPLNFSSLHRSEACDDDNCACAERPDAYHPLFTARVWVADDLKAQEIKAINEYKVELMWQKMKNWSIQSTYAELYGEG